MALFFDVINNYILENKEILRQYICKKTNLSITEVACTYYITKGKYKNTVCGRKAVSEGYCKVHNKYLIQSKDVSMDTIVGIELTEFICQGKKFLKTIDNIVYGKFDRGYFPIGEYEEYNDTVIYYT